MQKIGAELGARYILEGGVRKAGGKVRVTVQLIDAQTGHHIWAQKLDRDLEDIFAIGEPVLGHYRCVSMDVNDCGKAAFSWLSTIVAVPVRDRTVGAALW